MPESTWEFEVIIDTVPDWHSNIVRDENQGTRTNNRYMVQWTIVTLHNKTTWFNIDSFNTVQLLLHIGDGSKMANITRLQTEMFGVDKIH